MCVYSFNEFKKVNVYHPNGLKPKLLIKDLKISRRQCCSCSQTYSIEYCQRTFCGNSFTLHFPCSTYNIIKTTNKLRVMTYAYWCFNVPESRGLLKTNERWASPITVVRHSCWVFHSTDFPMWRRLRYVPRWILLNCFCRCNTKFYNITQTNLRNKKLNF